MQSFHSVCVCFICSQVQTEQQNKRQHYRKKKKHCSIRGGRAWGITVEKAELPRQLLDLLNESIYLGLYLFEDLLFRGSWVLLDKFRYGEHGFVPICFNLFFSGQLLPEVLEESGTDHRFVELIRIFDFLQGQEQANLLQQIATVS